MGLNSSLELADVAIVGGGIVGCSAAWRLAERGLKVALFERGVVASEQSSRAWGFVRQQGRHEAEVQFARVQPLGILDAGLRPSGTRYGADPLG